MPRVPTSLEVKTDIAGWTARTYEWLGLLYAAAPYAEDQFSSSGNYDDFVAALSDALDSVHTAQGKLN